MPNQEDNTNNTVNIQNENIQNENIQNENIQNENIQNENIQNENIKYNFPKLDSSHYPNYLMILAKKYFSNTKKIRKKKLVKRLQNKGVTVLHDNYITEFVNEPKTYKFNECIYPKLNTLYIHLFNGEYYSEDIFSKKKMERERDILFLLAGKLGVHTIKYQTDISEVVVKSVGSGIKVLNTKMNGKYNKSITHKDTIKGKEEYLNRGSADYLLSLCLDQVEENIKDTLSDNKANIFSYDFYNNNVKLRTFVYKRYNFKMVSLEYTTETEDITDRSFEIRSILMNYGIGISYEKYERLLEKTTYEIEFFTDEELRIKLDHNLQFKNDQLCVIKELYNDMRDQGREKEIIYRISQYVFKVSKIFKYGKKFIIDNKEIDKEIPYYYKLNKWFEKNSAEKFEKICEQFNTTFQIKLWLKNTLKLKEGEYIIDKLYQPKEDFNFFDRQKKKYIKYFNKKKSLDHEDKSFDHKDNDDKSLDHKNNEDKSLDQKDKEDKSLGQKKKNKNKNKKGVKKETNFEEKKHNINIEEGEQYLKVNNNEINNTLDKIFKREKQINEKAKKIDLIYQYVFDKANKSLEGVDLINNMSNQNNENIKVELEDQKSFSENPIMEPFVESDYIKDKNNYKTYINPPLDNKLKLTKENLKKHTELQDNLKLEFNYDNDDDGISVTTYLSEYDKIDGIYCDSDILGASIHSELFSEME